ncbi:hypothetical protein GCM10009715_10460 [Paeniglutamicibacter psychrophenolicus]|uniref:Ketohydroxyglutarate aldolase n=1 Tax=Paeniglutamicibacter psychrophenolicus TaxID=257454 RepID=A0ABS4WG23_9MICC|nr:hypothetical protein [Paeniglutamicibacter psychrophenolicus]MBP2375147.1 hypothetical protein [Paeniglutamicibacter psychrophenolicus]
MDDSPGLPPQQTVTFIVTVQDAYLERIKEVTKELETAGLKIDRVLGTLGQVVGHAKDSGRNQLAGVRGVESVVPERRLGIGPPESDVQ